MKELLEASRGMNEATICPEAPGARSIATARVTWLAIRECARNWVSGQLTSQLGGTRRLGRPK